jgi:hypothetical protein
MARCNRHKVDAYWCGWLQLPLGFISQALLALGKGASLLRRRLARNSLPSVGAPGYRPVPSPLPGVLLWELRFGGTDDGRLAALLSSW